MNYDTFIKLVESLKKYITENSEVLVSPPKIHKHLLKGRSYDLAVDVMVTYRNYVKGECTLDYLVAKIIYLKYPEDTEFENCIGERTLLKYVPTKGHPNKIGYKVHGFIEFMMKY